MLELLRRNKLTRIGVEIYEKNKAVWLYLFFGGVTTLINIFAYALFTKVFHVDYMVSNVIAWVLAVIAAYVTNKIYVFESKTTRKKELLKEITSFFIARVLTLLLDVAVMYVGVSLLEFNDIVMKILANVIVIISNYFLSKYIIFKNGGNK